ncbi:MAG: PstC family ABC transporter permease [Microthrixaceae bacterium]
MLPVAQPRISLADLRGDRRRTRTEKLVRILLFAAALTSVAISAAIILSLLGQTWTFVSQVELSSLWSDGWFPRARPVRHQDDRHREHPRERGAMVVAVPLGLGAAVYLSEYASQRARKWLKPTLEILAGIPSVVLGFFALAFISPQVVQRIFSEATAFSMAAAGIGVGILVIPLMATISEDAMRSVPDALREASTGVGARKITTTVKVVIPAAVSGLVAAFIVAISRANGETMVVFIAAGATGGSLFSTDVLGPGQTMTAAMASQAAGTDQVRGEALTFQSLFFVGMLLFLFTLVLNLAADRFVRRVRQAY